MIQDKAILMKLTVPSFSFTRTDQAITNKTLVEHNSAAGSGRFVKSILPKEITKPFTKLIDEVYEYHRTHTLPWGDDGTRMLPTAEYMTYMATFVGFDSRLAVIANDYEHRRDEILLQAQQRLNGMFKMTDYPSPGEIAAKRIKREPLPIPGSGDFRVTLGNDQISSLNEAVERRLEQARQDARNDLFRRLSEPLAKMVNKLSDPEGVFRDTLVTNLREVSALIPALNITDDPGIESVRARVESELCSYSPDLLRESTAVRNVAMTKAQSILDNLAEYAA